MNLRQVRINFIYKIIDLFKNPTCKVFIKYRCVYSIYLNSNVISNKDKYLEVINWKQQ